MISRRNFLKGAGLAGGTLALVGCGGGGGAATTDDTTTEETGGELISVGIINNDPNESGYRTANDKDMKETFTEENGFAAEFAYSMKNEEQIASAQQFIQNGVKYLLVSAADTAGWDTPLKDAQDAGTQTILFDRVVDAPEDLYVAAVVSDMDAEGQTAVDWLTDQALPEYNIIHIQGVMGSAAQVGRTGALDEAVAAKKVGRESTVAGRANVLIFPDLNSANLAVKIVQRFAHGAAYGHTLSGFKCPVADSSRGATVDEIVGDIAMLVLSAR